MLLSTESDSRPTYRNRVSGILRSHGGQPIAGGTVTVSGDSSTVYSDPELDTTTSNPVTTDASGKFEFYLPVGAYTLTYAATGWTLTETSEAIIVEDGPPTEQSATSGGGLTLLERQVVGVGGVAAVTFSSIDQTYELLEVHLMLRGETAATAVASVCRFNGDTGANYDMQRNTATNGTVAAANAIGQTSFDIASMPAASATAGKASQWKWTIAGYSRTTFHKTVLATGGRWDDNTAATGTIDTRIALWRSTAAITSISIAASSGDIAEGSVATLYGLRGSL